MALLLPHAKNSYYVSNGTVMTSLSKFENRAKHLVKLISDKDNLNQTVSY
jgi:hypothetical protein